MALKCYKSNKAKANLLFYVTDMFQMLSMFFFGAFYTCQINFFYFYNFNTIK